MECTLCRAGESRSPANFCEECGAPLRALPAPAPERPADPRAHLERTVGADLAAVSDRGLRHAANEDACALGATGELRCLVVCDGVSRSHRPAEAAERAAAVCLDALLAGHGLSGGVAAAEAAVRTLAAASDVPAHLDPPECTLVAARLRQRRVELAWLGDSRAYFVGAEGPALPLTRDHSWAEEAIASGQLTAAEARAHPDAACVLRTLGGPLQADDLPDEPELVRFDAPGPGWLLLCTDGWWRYHPDPALLARLFRAAERDTAAAAEPLLALARLLVQAACRCGGRDNVTVALARIS
ncbi:MAG: protein phosphatase 2C domain-containing protein [Verrucomicrobia bacterium]|nr:protein phosphatase 2C domain-containing protein [Verrucomicrobiota bacterium]